MRRAAALALLIAWALPISHASGSEQSQALSARALIELNAGHTQQALALLDQAVTADPNDANVRYQRGATRAKLGDTKGAIEDLQAALAIRPDFTAAQLELGIELTEAGQYQEAYPWLVQAQRDPDLDAQASFYLGLGHLRMGRLDDAQESFERARQRDPALETNAQYYEGVIAYRRRKMGTAKAHFTAVEQANPDTPLARESAQFLDLISQGERASYSAYGTTALEYDSNVTLGPSSTTPTEGAITGKGDGRVVLDVGGTYVPLKWGRASVGLSYEFFQSLQFHLTDFDLQDNRPAIQFMLDFDWLFVGLQGRYDYYLLSTDSFLSEMTALPWVTAYEYGIGHTDLYYRMQRRDYKQLTFGVLNGYYNFAGVRQVVDLGHTDRQAWVGYELGFSKPFTETGLPDPSACLPDVNGNIPDNCQCRGSNAPTECYQYGAQQIEVGLRWPLPYSITTELVYRYEHQSYDAASAVFAPPTPAVPPNGGPRRDNDHRAIVSFMRPLPEVWDHLFVNATWFGTFNNSNKTVFQYDRQIGSLGLEVRF
jgi:tetratricopeptide (TPR) repeat protein